MPDGRKVNTKHLQSAYQSNHYQHQNHNQQQHHNQNHHYHQQNQHNQSDGGSSSKVNNKGSSNLMTSSSDSSPSDIINTVEPISINSYYNTSQNLGQLYPNNQQPTQNYNNTYSCSFENSSNPSSNYNTTNQNSNYSGAFMPPASSVQISSTAPAATQSTTIGTSPFNGISIWSNSPSNQFANSVNAINTNVGAITNGGNASSSSAQSQFARSISFSNPNSTSMRLTSSVNTAINNTNFNSMPSNPNSSFSHSFNQSFGSPSQLLFTSPISSANTQTYSAIVDSAILDSDDDNDENDPKNLGRESEDVDFVPSSLNDLLTPQELKRRLSRSSFGSQHPLITMSSVKDPYSLIEEDTPFIMD